MTDDTYRSRIAEVESYFDRRAWRYGGRGDLYLPDADTAMRHVLECVDADYYGLDRPSCEIPGPELRAETIRVLSHFDALWR